MYCGLCFFQVDICGLVYSVLSAFFSLTISFVAVLDTFFCADIICSGTGFSFPLILFTCIFCYMSPKRQRWSDHDIDAVEPRLPEQTSLCVLWNVVLWPETLASAWASCGSNLVKDVLGLNDNFPDEFLQATYVDVRFVGVPLEPGISPENRVYECFGISLVVIKHARTFDDVFCQESNTKEQKQCCKTLVMRVQENHLSDLTSLPKNDALSLWEISTSIYGNVFLAALARAAVLHHTCVRNYGLKQHTTEGIQK